MEITLDTKLDIYVLLKKKKKKNKNHDQSEKKTRGGMGERHEPNTVLPGSYRKHLNTE